MAEPMVVDDPRPVNAPVSRDARAPAPDDPSSTDIPMAAAATDAAAATTAATTTATADPKVVTLHKGGIVKKILREGTGDAMPPAGADVEVHYVGRLLDGTKFDSSRDRNDTFTFKIGRGQVIKGWDDGVATMRKGELALLTCKPEYAYGAGGSPPKIPPNATLEFEVELFGWTKKQKVTDDRQVMKEVEKEGEGWNKPNENAKCSVRWRARVAGAAEYFASAHWEQPQSVVLTGDTTHTEGFEESVKNMLKGEHSHFTVQPSYGYGAAGNAELKVPGDATLEYEIVLVDFEKGRESFEMSGDEKIAFGTAKKQAGNDLFKRGDLARAAKRYASALALFKYDKQFDAAQMAKVNELKVACNANVSIVKFKARDYKAAEEACNEVLAIDPKHVKCLFRRAQIFAHRNEFDAALRDLSAAKALDPKNADVSKLWAAVEARVSAARAKERNMWAGAFGKVSLVSADEEKKARDAAAAAAAAKPPNSDDGDDDDEPAPATAAAAATAAAPAPAADAKPAEAAAPAAADATK